MAFAISIILILTVLFVFLAMPSGKIKKGHGKGERALPYVMAHRDEFIGYKQIPYNNPLRLHTMKFELYWDDGGKSYVDGDSLLQIKLGTLSGR